MKRPTLRLPKTTTDVVTSWTAPFEAVASTVMPYVSLGKTVGSKVASGSGGVPLPDAITTSGPGSRAW